MFDIIPKLLSSVASFLFPLFASYKALKTADPAQLTPWLMYWSVLSCALLVESWLEFILVWVPFYSYMRLFFLLYLVLPQTQGARLLYETYLHPYLEENEASIEEFIATTHERLKAAGIAYLKQAIEAFKTKALGMPPQEIHEEPPRPASVGAQGYTQALLSRFSVPAARWAVDNAGNTGQDFYNLLAGAMGAAAGGMRGSAAADSGSPAPTMPGSLIPDNINGTQEKMTFLAAQRERLAFVLSALDQEASNLEKTEQAKVNQRANSLSLDGGSPSRPPSGHSMWSALSKSRSEVDFEKIEAESGAEDNSDVDNGSGTVRQRKAEPTDQPVPNGWSFLGWGTVGTGSGKSSGVDKDA